MRGAGPISITLPQFKRQWLVAVNRFTLNVWNFEVQVGAAAVEVFQDSFRLRRFNNTSSPSWQMRNKSNLGGFTVGSLMESGSLRRSIKYKVHDDRSGVTIYTDPAAFSGSYKHKGFCYAAVHNEDSSEGTRTGHMANMPQRRFMGHSKVLDRKMKLLEVEILKGFPK